MTEIVTEKIGTAFGNRDENALQPRLKLILSKMKSQLWTMDFNETDSESSQTWSSYTQILLVLCVSSTKKVLRIILLTVTTPIYTTKKGKERLMGRSIETMILSEDSQHNRTLRLRIKHNGGRLGGTGTGRGAAKNDSTTVCNSGKRLATAKTVNDENTYCNHRRCSMQFERGYDK